MMSSTPLSSSPVSGRHVGAWLLRGEILSLTADPFQTERPEEVLWHEADGGLWIGADGTILACGPWARVSAQALQQQPSLPVVDGRGHLIVPGLIDAHCHFPQLDLIGTYSGALLEWLNASTFPLEEDFASAAIAQSAAAMFVHCLYEQGTTTAAIFASSHVPATEIMFQVAWQSGLRAVIGKVSMDRHAPASLLVDVDADMAASESLIQQWHGRGGRLHYALTPRFAPSCSPELLRALAALRARYPDIYLQTHHAENLAEVAWVRQLFPAQGDYLGVYEHFGLLGPRTLLAHSIHVTAREQACMAAHGSHVVHCPTSNLFLGSGLCGVRALKDAQVGVCLGSDVGAGTTFSLWQTMASAYQVARLRGEPLHPAQLFYLATLGGAEALRMASTTGSLAVGKAADLQMIAWDAHPLLRRRFAQESPSQKLFSLMHFVDRQCIKGVWVQGQRVYDAASRLP